MVDGNTYAINQHLAALEHADAEEKASWPLCEACGEASDPFYMDDEGYCDACLEEHNAEMAGQYLSLYKAEKRAGLLKSKEELDADLRDAGRGHLVRPQDD